MIERLDGIIVDFKESIEDFGFEVRSIIDKAKALEARVVKLEKEIEDCRCSIRHSVK
ncbi:MAG: hypothetical protein WCK67_06820 [bacterium]